MTKISTSAVASLISTQGAKKDFSAVVANGFEKTAVLDVCHAGVSDRLATNDDAVSQLVTASGASMIILSASKGCQLGEEDAGSRGGRFSVTIDNNLTKRRGAFDLDGNGAISVAELDRGLKAEVVRDSKGRQTPWLSRNLMVGDFDIFWALCGPRQRWHDTVHDSFSRETDIRLATLLTLTGPPVEPCPDARTIALCASRC